MDPIFPQPALVVPPPPVPTTTAPVYSMLVGEALRLEAYAATGLINPR